VVCNNEESINIPGSVWLTILGLSEEHKGGLDGLEESEKG
jgi:hypothetical protein